MTILDVVAKAIYEHHAEVSSFIPHTYEAAQEMDPFWRPLAFTHARETAKRVIDQLAISGYLQYGQEETNDSTSQS